MTLTRKDFHVGQTVWLRPLNSFTWVGKAKIKDETPIPVTVKTVGTKYITVQKNEWCEYKFDIDTYSYGLPFLHQHVDFGAIEFDLYMTEQEVLDASERDRLIDAHRSLFSLWSQIPCTVQQLRESAKILGIEEE